MIRAVTFTNYLGDSIRLDLARPEESGFIIKSVTGLGPGKANINTTEIATNDGSLFNCSSMEKISLTGTLYRLRTNTGTRQKLVFLKLFAQKIRTAIPSIRLLRL